MTVELFKQLLMFVVTIATYISFLPQLIQLYKTKSSGDISVSSWSIWTFSSLCYLIFALLNGGFGLIVSAVSELVLTASTLLLAIIYKKK